MIDTEEAAAAAVQSWLDGLDGEFRVKALADGGQVWRAVTGKPGTHLGEFCAQVDKATGVVQAGFVQETGPSARDGYLRMMRTTVVPELRRLGFTGSGRRFTLQAPKHLGTIEFQQSQGNTWMGVRFTVNVSAASPSAWTARLGLISHHGCDHWWSVWAGFPSDDAAADLITAIRDHAVPAIKGERHPPGVPTADLTATSLGQRIRDAVSRCVHRSRSGNGP
ncbi:DUF4304 domain-containing protein [Actinoplanes oblitus]|uniref:DUF4304 domain-containing protein n=1 Tax=Actinoplanes oblitus TaxID=3040509 RepID=A0ABY8WQV1_9ACTN|nr:DUF4304 domain-containing protein [Actinoplanes oblitus]WIN00287.1 DUF4304 domain-containing protein [Actinoplanes oblitus]